MINKAKIPAAIHSELFPVDAIEMSMDMIAANTRSRCNEAMTIAITTAHVLRLFR